MNHLLGKHIQIDVGHLRLRSTRVGQSCLHISAAVLAALLNLANVAIGGAMQAVLSERGVPQNSGQQVVEVVRHSTG
jgi:hypothetical protein